MFKTTPVRRNNKIIAYVARTKTRFMRKVKYVERTGADKDFCQVQHRIRSSNNWQYSSWNGRCASRCCCLHSTAARVIYPHPLPSVAYLCQTLSTRVEGGETEEVGGEASPWPPLRGHAAADGMRCQTREGGRIPRNGGGMVTRGEISGHRPASAPRLDAAPRDQSVLQSRFSLSRQKKYYSKPVICQHMQYLTNWLSSSS